jgi:hypothetical protein
MPFYAQHKIAHKIEALVSQKTAFRHFTPLTLKSGADTGTTDAVVSKATYAVMNAGVVKEIANMRPEHIELDIPYNGSIITVQLYKQDVLAQGFHVDTDKQTNIPYEKGAHYRGIIKGDGNSLAAFNFFKGEMSGIISSAQLNNLVIGKLHTPGNVANYIIYSDAQLNILNDFKCAVAPPAKKANDVPVAPPGTLSGHCVTMYFEIDHDIYLQNGSDTGITSNWMTSVFNNVQTLYDNDGITTAIKSVYIWTEQDPYMGDDSGDYLFQFNDVRPVFDGDLGQLVGIDTGGLGGVAVGIAGICSEYNFSYAEVEIWYDTVPLFSWTVEVITHELGHLMGSPHTHGCYWNGDDTAIDGCGSSVGYVEGDCEQGPIPSAEEQGTIMSYCHLVWGVGINFANGFGEQPAARIADHVSESMCLSTDCINTCINTIASYAVVDSSATSATIIWTDESSSSWEVAVAPVSGDLEDWQVVTENTFTATDLNPDIYYKFGVRPVCPDYISPAHELTFSAGNNYCTGGISFVDTGGVFGNYKNDQYLIKTITPDNPTQKVQVTFVEFNIEEDYDFMSVYDGNSTSAMLIGTYTGNELPPAFESTAEDGSLTFEFSSDSWETHSGWMADVSCTASLGLAGQVFAEFSYYPNPAKGIVNIQAGNAIDTVMVYNVAGQLLLTQKVDAPETAVNLSSFADGVYFFRAVSGTAEKNFRIVKQN